MLLPVGRMYIRMESAMSIIVDKIRQTFDNASVTTDIMVGFPGETEEEFAASLAFLDIIIFSIIFFVSLG
jgi:threonylcarbamoyladenosine tRNA methylthiotransferase MtaB